MHFIHSLFVSEQNKIHFFGCRADDLILYSKPFQLCYRNCNGAKKLIMKKIGLLLLLSSCMFTTSSFSQVVEWKDVAAIFYDNCTVCHRPGEIGDGFINATGNGTKDISETIKGMQSGKVQSYAIYFLAGVIGLALLFIYWWT